MEQHSMKGRVALVTGGGRGIGRGICELLAAEGATVAVNYRRDEAAAADTVKSITDAGGTAKAYRASVEDVDAARTMVNSVIADFGFIDILVNNAGVGSTGRTVAETEPAEVERLLRVHAMAPHWLSAAVLPSMRTRPRGDIVMISSSATRRMRGNGAPYNMAKAAMDALAMTLSNEERVNNVRVNIVAPGLVETDLGRKLAVAWGKNDIRDFDAESPYGHVVQPVDVARAVLFFCSSMGTYVSGERLYVDGGGPMESF
jgi:NAD(P)-dependent dehydrogenase (short-subunit alcohol dehydrogenase family)